ncbi:MAG: 30S ribosomal protein S19e [Nanoarchaeota archaeon]
MVTVYDANANQLIEKASEELKKLVKAPSWAPYVKTGAGRERPPADKDWYYKRLASILRRVYILGPIGVNRLRTKYSGKRNVGVTGERVYKGSGKVIRTCLQELEKLQLVKKVEKGIHKGKIITGKGKSFLDKIAKEIK